MPTTDASQGVSNCYVFKSRLQEFAQKVGFTTPVYETTKEGPSHEPTFRSTVIVNNVRYDSLLGFYNRKAAEQSAAEVALMELSRWAPMIDCISLPVHETGLCKNLLQEYAQKMNYAIPVYHCHRDETPGRPVMFSCTVETGGMRYIGAAARTKKEAEIKAARTALLAIQADKSVADPNSNSVHTVVPCKKKVPDFGIKSQENNTSLKPKKKHFKMKLSKKKRAAVKRDTVRVQDTGDQMVQLGDQHIKVQGAEVSSADQHIKVKGVEVSSAEVTESKDSECLTDVGAPSIPYRNGDSSLGTNPPSFSDCLRLLVKEANEVPFVERLNSTYL